MSLIVKLHVHVACTDLEKGGGPGTPLKIQIYQMYVVKLPKICLEHPQQTKISPRKYFMNPRMPSSQYSKCLTLYMQ